MNEHVRMDHQQTKQQIVYVCDECEENFSSRADFRIHAKEAHMKNRFTCDHCGSKLSSIEDLDNHIEKFHIKTKHSLLL